MKNRERRHTIRVIRMTNGWKRKNVNRLKFSYDDHCLSLRRSRKTNRLLDAEIFHCFGLKLFSKKTRTSQQDFSDIHTHFVMTNVRLDKIFVKTTIFQTF